MEPHQRVLSRFASNQGGEIEWNNSNGTSESMKRTENVIVNVNMSVRLNERVSNMTFDEEEKMQIFNLYVVARLAGFFLGKDFQFVSFQREFGCQQEDID